jgi:dethiobiotin synthetase
LRDPLAPLVAARREGLAIDLGHIAECHAQVARQHDLTLIEGAGGLLVPLAEGVSFVELALRLDARLVVVVGNRLGAINHALLTLRHAQAAGLNVSGYVINTLFAESDLARDTNLALLDELAGASLGVVPFLASLEMREDVRAELSRIGTKNLDLARFL